MLEKEPTVFVAHHLVTQCTNQNEATQCNRSHIFHTDFQLQNYVVLNVRRFRPTAACHFRRHCAGHVVCQECDACAVSLRPACVDLHRDTDSVQICRTRACCTDCGAVCVDRATRMSMESLHHHHHHCCLLTSAPTIAPDWPSPVLTRSSDLMSDRPCPSAEWRLPPTSEEFVGTGEWRPGWRAWRMGWQEWRRSVVEEWRAR